MNRLVIGVTATALTVIGGIAVAKYCKKKINEKAPELVKSTEELKKNITEAVNAAIDKTIKDIEAVATDVEHTVETVIEDIVDVDEKEAGECDEDINVDIDTDASEDTKDND